MFGLRKCEKSAFAMSILCSRYALGLLSCTQLELANMYLAEIRDMWKGKASKAESMKS